jgi:hypothetical protein
MRNEGRNEDYLLLPNQRAAPGRLVCHDPATLPGGADASKRPKAVFVGQTTLYHFFPLEFLFSEC